MENMKKNIYHLTVHSGGIVIIFPKARCDKLAAQKLLESVDGAFSIVNFSSDDQIYYGVLVDFGDRHEYLEGIDIAIDYM